MIDKKSSLWSSPINWNISKLWEIWYFIRWVSYKKWDLLPKRENGCISLLRSNNIQTELDLSELQYLNKSSVNDGQITQKWDILFCMSNWSPHLVWKNILLPELENYSFGAFCSIFRKTSESALSEYIAKYLQSWNYTSFITSLSRWAGINNLRGSDLENIEIPLPPLETQKAIVAKLDQIFAELDQTKSEIQKNLDNTDELWKSALNQAFQGDWKMKKLGEVCKFVRWPFWWSLKKEIFVKEWFAVYEQQHAIYNQFSDFRYFIDDKKFEEMKRFEVLPWDLIMSCSWTMGKVSIVPENSPKWIINQALLKITPSTKINAKFLKMWMDSKDFQDQIWINTQWAAIQNVASVKVISELNMPVPPLSEQEKIVEHLDQVSKEVKGLKSQYQSQLDNLEELKKSVLDKAFKWELE